MSSQPVNKWDPHTLYAAQIFGIDPVDVHPNQRVFAKSKRFREMYSHKGPLLPTPPGGVQAAVDMVKAYRQDYGVVLSKFHAAVLMTQAAVETDKLVQRLRLK